MFLLAWLYGFVLVLAALILNDRFLMVSTLCLVALNDDLGVGNGSGSRCFHVS